jgi:lysophospholipase L1-like esterase
MKQRKNAVVSCIIVLFLVLANPFNRANALVEGITGEDREESAIDGSNMLICAKCNVNEQCVIDPNSNKGLKHCIPKPQEAETIRTDSGRNLEIELERINDKLPIPEINIPGLNFSKATTSIDENGDTYILIPWIAQFISTIYKFSVGIVSIIAVIMIIIAGIRIIISSAGGEGTQESYKKIAHALIGLLIAWGSFAILYNINPNLIEFNALKVKVITAMPLEEMIFTKTPGYEEAYLKPDSERLNKLFAAYGSCYGLNPGILKAVAAVESGLNPAANPGKKYQGLFQMDRDYCQAGLIRGKYPQSLGLNCENRIDPEVNTAAAAATIDVNLKSILQRCPKASYQDALLLLYVAHNNGPAVKEFAINHDGCYGDSIRLMVRAYYDSQPGGNRKGVDADYGQKKYEFGFRVVKYAENYGATTLYPNGMSDALCPKKTHLSALSQNIPVTGKKILAVGDSLTAGPSHASKLQELTGIPVFKAVDGEAVAVVGQGTQAMFDEIKDKRLKSEGFTDLLIMGGINDIIGDTGNCLGGHDAAYIEGRLTLIYEKAKSENMRVIALTITPFYNYYGKWCARKQTTLEAINDWIRAGGGGKIDVVIDANKIVADPASNKQLLDDFDGFYPSCPGHPEYNCPTHGRSLHFNAAGHAAIAAEEKAKAF